MTKFSSELLDVAINSFKTDVWVPGEVLFHNAPEGFGDAIRFLVKEGLLEESRNHYKITFKGKALVDNGGFVAKYRRERIQFYSVIIATVVGVISLAVSIIAIFL